MKITLPGQPDNVHLSVGIGVSTGYADGGRLGATLFVYHPAGSWDSGAVGNMSFLTHQSRDWENRLNAEIEKVLANNLN